MSVDRRASPTLGRLSGDRREQPERRDVERGGGRRSDDAPELLTVAQAAEEARTRCGKDGESFSERTLWRHIEKGALPIIRCGPYQRPRIRRADFEAYLHIG